jgi:hypothetical protein
MVIIITVKPLLNGIILKSRDYHPGILKKKPGGKGRPAHKADKFAAIC